jgi:hypothetical protein
MKNKEDKASMQEKLQRTLRNEIFTTKPYHPIEYAYS